MNRLRITGALILFLIGGALALNSTVPSEEGDLDQAEKLFSTGKFTPAEKIYRAVLAADPKDIKATIRMGNLELLKNNLAEAESWLLKAEKLNSQDESAKKLLALAYYRRDEFERAVPLYRSLGNEAVAKKLESFKGLVPYEIEGPEGRSSLKFIHTDPLPLIRVGINGREEVNFIIDTGASEVYIDTEFAKTVGTAPFGSTTGLYGGGQQAATGHGRIDSLALGEFVIRNIPVLILNTRRFAAAARGKQVDGILGTLLLSHFIPTLDYTNGELILRRKTKEELGKVEQQAQSEKWMAIPFWMAGDHYIVAWGQANKSQPLLFFVDTGLAGGGFTCPASVVQEAGIKLPEGAESEGIGGGGKVKVVPFVVDELSLGPATERSVPGFFGPFPPSLESSEGFRIGGIISHQFFRSYALTFDFSGMKLYLSGRS